MAAELEKLAQTLKERGYKEGSQIVSSVATALHKGGFIPERLDEPLPPFVFDRLAGVPDYIHEIDALNLSPRVRNVLVRAGMTEIRKLYDSSDETLLETRKIGKSGLAEIRSSLSEFRDRIVGQRQKDGVGQDSTVILPYPTTFKRQLVVSRILSKS